MSEQARWHIINVRKPGGLIHPGFNVQWIGGPIMWVMPKSKRWRIRARLRMYNHYPPDPWFWNPGLSFEIITVQPGAILGTPAGTLLWGLEWNSTTHWPKIHWRRPIT
jgi:hypothetical protein